MIVININMIKKLISRGLLSHRMPDPVVAQTVMWCTEIGCYQVFLSNSIVTCLQINYKTKH